MTDPSVASAPFGLRIVVSGLVQGVNYRRWLREEALKHGVSGWVRNLADGSVEAVLHGEKRAVEETAEACRRGPSHARVDNLQCAPADYAGPRDFRIEPTV